MRLPSGKSTLRKAIERGLANRDLDAALEELGEITLKSSQDAEDVCWGLQQVQGDKLDQARDVSALLGLCQEIEDCGCDAFEVLQEHATPELLRLYEQTSRTPDDEQEDRLLYLLKVLALYGTVAGTLKIVEAARRPLKPEGYMWSVILRIFSANHPEKELLYNSLRDPLPPGFIAVSLLDASNAVLIEGDAMAHPFDSPDGHRKLREWLLDADPDKFSYAHSATSALPFITEPGRKELLTLALNHADPEVRMEAAWADAKIGSEEGVRRLADLCLNFSTAHTAIEYLTELQREDMIPSQAREPGFTAVAEFARWLAHPNELGRAPDAMEIIDQRELRWPPEREPRTFWLIKYTCRDLTGLGDDDVECGVIGSITFCFFSYKLSQRPPEDAYAIHCHWEMEHKNLLEQTDVQESPGEYDNLLAQWTGPPLEKPVIQYVTEISPELDYPQRLVGLASARLGGEEGWVVLDGPRSEWYPAAEQPSDVFHTVVLEMHLGRHLLGFTDKPDRKKFLQREKPPKPSAQVIAGYEKILADALAMPAAKWNDQRGGGPLRMHFNRYIQALSESGRGADVPAVIDKLAPHWDDPQGNSDIALAAHQVGHWDLAEQFFLKYRDGCSNYERGEEMGLLAGMWCRAGKTDAARELLLTCLERLLAQSKTATGSDKGLFERWYQGQRAVFLKLFPSEGDSSLTARSLPASTLK